MGKKIHGLSPQEIVRSGIAHVPEGRRVFPYMTVYENLKMGAFRRRDKKKFERTWRKSSGTFRSFKKGRIKGPAV